MSSDISRAFPQFGGETGETNPAVALQLEGSEALSEGA